MRRQSLRRNIGQPRTLLPLSRSWFKGTLLEAHWPYRRGQVRRIAKLEVEPQRFHQRRIERECAFDVGYAHADM
ncbi:hypothetical protein DM52_2816 [Burkholderia mallei]|nr:hypothetical protein DM52_2816 [Burkholderia mallei]